MCVRWMDIIEARGRNKTLLQYKYNMNNIISLRFKVILCMKLNLNKLPFNAVSV